MVEPADVEGTRIVARRVLRSKYVVADVDGKQRVLFPAFEEFRPGGLSLDILWFEQAGQSKQERLLSRALKVATNEGHATIGWASFSVRILLSKEKHAVKRVLATPNDTNPDHADLIAKHVLCITADDSKEDAEDKAHHLAKTMAEFCYEHGLFYSAPTSPLLFSPPCE